MALVGKTNSGRVRHAGAERIDQAVQYPRWIAPTREHPGQIVGQTETPLGHRQKYHAPIRARAPAIEGSCDFVSSVMAGVAFAVDGDGGLCNRILSRISVLHHARKPLRRPLANKTGF